MPYYVWRSIDEAGVIHKGVSFAVSKNELDAVLFEQGKALMAAHERSYGKHSARSLKFLRTEFFGYFSHLVNAGVFIPDALELCARQTSSLEAQHSIHALSLRVRQGLSLSAALALEEGAFTPLMISMIQVGEESGSLGPVAAVLSLYAQNDALFYQRVRSALLMPLVTFFFFMSVASLFLLVAVPYFAETMVALGIAMPPLTRTLLSMQTFLTGWGLGIMLFAGLIGWFFTKRVLKVLRTYNSFQRMLLHFPVYGVLVKARATVQMSRAFAVLLDRGVPVKAALLIVKGLVAHPLLYKKMEELEDLVCAGYAMSDALEITCGDWLPHEVPAFIRLGESSGHLAPFFEQTAERAQKQVDTLLSRITTLVQPIALLLLGIVIALLITALYVPLLEMAQGIQ